MTPVEAAAKIRNITGVTPRIDGLLSALKGKLVFDLLPFYKDLSDRHPKYDNENCTYDGKEDVSMSEAIELMFCKEINGLFIIAFNL